eukprot:11207184-Lingulodinium_polyedra.AAC.1
MRAAAEGAAPDVPAAQDEGDVRGLFAPPAEARLQEGPATEVQFEEEPPRAESHGFGRRPAEGPEPGSGRAERGAAE